MDSLFNIGGRLNVNDISKLFCRFLKRKSNSCHYRRNLFISRRVLSCSSFGSKSYYDMLGVSPNSTQAQIKSAYYNLSKLYHPDRNEGRAEAVNRFREVTEAYKVLGNIQLRKQYDKGLFSHASSFVDEDYTKGFTGQKRVRKSPPTGKTKIYDFDEFYRMHYGETIKREADARDKFYQKMERKDKNMKQNDGLLISALVLLGEALQICFI